MVLALAFWSRGATTRPVAEPLPLARLDVDLGADLPLGSEHGTDAVLSPDGTRLVYVSQSRLFTRTLDQRCRRELSGTEGAYDPFFSPDGQWVAFFTPGKLKKVSLQGGAPITLCDTGLSSGGSWGEDGSIVAAIDVFGLSRIASNRGSPQADGARAGRSYPPVAASTARRVAVMFSVYRSASVWTAPVSKWFALRMGSRKVIQRSATLGAISARAGI